MVLDGKSSQEYLVNAGVPQGSILGLTLFLLHINDIPVNVICDVAIHADDTTRYFKCDQASDLCQYRHLQDPVDWGKKWLVDFNAGKNQLVSFGSSSNNVSIDAKMDVPVLEEKSSFKMLGLSFHSKLDWRLLHYLYC